MKNSGNKKEKAVAAETMLRDEETGGMYENGFFLNHITVWQVAKYFIMIITACILTHCVITFGHVCYTQYKIVCRYRQVALDEMQQDCCRIFYTNRAAFIPESDSSRYALATHDVNTNIINNNNDNEKINQCHRILADDKVRRGGVNRCENAQDVINHVFSYQVVLEVWNYYFPFANMSFLQYFITGSVNAVSSSIGMYVIKKFFSF